MAEKKSEKTKEPTTLDVSSMNVWERLLNIRNEFYSENIKKSGVNDHADFLYFELVDIVPLAEALFTKYRLFMQPTFENGNALARVIVIDKPEDVATFTIPLVLIEQPGKYRMNEIQGVGSAVTYYRRYLYMIILDLVEKDEIDDKPKPKTPDEQPPQKPSKPASATQRKAIKDDLTKENNAPATDEQIKALKSLLNDLMTADPEQEEFVQSIALKTKGFTKITAKACDDLIEGVTDMLTNYTEE